MDEREGGIENENSGIRKKHRTLPSGREVS